MNRKFPKIIIFELFMEKLGGLDLTVENIRENIFLFRGKNLNYFRENHFMKKKVN